MALARFFSVLLPSRGNWGARKLVILPRASSFSLDKSISLCYAWYRSHGDNRDRTKA